MSNLNGIPNRYELERPTGKVKQLKIRDTKKGCVIASFSSLMPHAENHARGLCKWLNWNDQSWEDQEEMRGR